MGAVDDALEKLHSMADDLEMDDDERENFITEAMTRKGFKQRSSWAEPEDDGNSGGGGSFVFGKKSTRETRRVPGRGDRGQGGGFTRYSAS